MDSKYNDSIKLFLLSFRRLYVVTAIKAGNMQMAMDYLKNNSSTLMIESEGLPNSDWSAWFSIPFINQPQVYKTITIILINRMIKDFYHFSQTVGKYQSKHQLLISYQQYL